MLYEDLLTHISKAGFCYRWTITTLIAVLLMKSAFDMFVLNLATASVPYHCSQAIVDDETFPMSSIVANSSFATNFSAFDFTCSKPSFRRGRDGLLHLLAGSNRSVEKCDSWTFKPDPPERWTMFIEYEMVCDRKYLMDRMQTVMQLGICLSTIFGPLGDIIGRKPFMIAFCYLDLACNIALIFVRDLNLHMVLRFFMGFGSPAAMIGVVLITELVAEEYRGIHGNLAWVLWVVAYSGSAGISYFVQNWRKQMVVVVIIIGAAYVTYIPVLPESPRWLLMKQKTVKAKRTLKEMCKYSRCKDVLDNFNFENNELVNAFRQTDEQRQVQRNCILQLLPQESLCRIEYIVTLGVVTFNFFTVSLVYFALSFERGFITRDPYLNVLVSGLLELPAYILAWQMSNRIGRMYTTISTMAFSGVGLIILPYIPTDPNLLFQASSVIASMIKFSATIAYSVVIVYGSEVLPTNVRSCSFLFASFLMGVGGLLAPELGGALAAIYQHLPYIFYGALSVAASLTVLLLPETRNKAMPNTVAEMEPVGCPCGAAREPNPRDTDANGNGEDLKPLRM